MIKSIDDLLGALAVLELRGGDTTSIEAKTFSEYSSAQMGPTMCAFANMPEGGVVLMGVSEQGGINVVGVDDVNSLLRSAASQARNGFSVSIMIDAHAFDLDGKTVGVVNVAGANTNDKPVRWKEDKKHTCASTTVTIKCRRRRSRCFFFAITARTPMRSLCPVALFGTLTQTWSNGISRLSARRPHASSVRVMKRSFITRASLRTAKVKSCRSPACMRWVSILSAFSRT